MQYHLPQEFLLILLCLLYKPSKYVGEIYTTLNIIPWKARETLWRGLSNGGAMLRGAVPVGILFADTVQAAVKCVVQKTIDIKVALTLILAIMSVYTIYEVIIISIVVFTKCRRKAQ